MAETTPIIQVLAKNNYAEQHLVSLPSAIPLAPLAPSSLRIKSTIISLTNNTTTYALLGHLPMFNWWDVHPLPSSIPSEFSDPTKYGRISAWGYGVVVESNASDETSTPIKVGSRVYGYLPIGTLPVDMQVRMDGDVPGQFHETSKHRETLMPVYNRYQLLPTTSSALGSKEKQSLGYDALFKILFETSYMMNRFVFAWEPKELVHPLMPTDGWTLEDAQLGNDDTVFICSPSGKTALSFAYSLKQGRPATKRPRAVVGIGSEASRAFTEGTGLYDHVLDYTQDSQDIDTMLNLKADAKIVLADFGSRGGAGDRWAAKLSKTHQNFIQISIGGEPAPLSNEEASANMAKRWGAKVEWKKHSINASSLRTQAYEVIGAKRYFEEADAEWDSWKARGLVPGLELAWGQGMEDVGKGWDRLVKGDVSPAEGLVFSLD